MLTIVNLYLNKNINFFAKRYYIHKSKKQSFLRKEYMLFFSPILRDLLRKKWIFSFLNKNNNSIATKMSINLLNNRFKIYNISE